MRADHGPEPTDEELEQAIEELRALVPPGAMPGRDFDLPSDHEKQLYLQQLDALKRTGAPERSLHRPAQGHVTHAPINRRRLFTLAAAVVSAAGVAVFTLDQIRPRPGYAVTPPPLLITPPADTTSPRRRLDQIARRAETSPDSAAADRPVEHLVIQRWDLHTQIDGRTVTSAVIPSERQLWRTANDEARITEKYLPPQFPTAQDRAAWHDDGAPGANTPDQVRDYPAGQFVAAWPDRPPRTTAALRTWLRRQDTSDAGIVKGVADLLRERVLTATERAGLLRLLAEEPAITYAGTTADRAGRPGLAFTATSTSSGGVHVYQFVIDADTSMFLAHEEVVTSGTDRLHLHYPAVIRYDTYLTAEFVATMP